MRNRLFGWPPVKCWVCMGRGWVQGISHPMTCPNPNCPHRKESADV